MDAWVRLWKWPFQNRCRKNENVISIKVQNKFLQCLDGLFGCQHFDLALLCNNSIPVSCQCWYPDISPSAEPANKKLLIFKEVVRDCWKQIPLLNLFFWEKSVQVETLPRKMANLTTIPSCWNSPQKAQRQRTGDLAALWNTWWNTRLLFWYYW